MCDPLSPLTMSNPRLCAVRARIATALRAVHLIRCLLVVGAIQFFVADSQMAAQQPASTRNAAGTTRERLLPTLHVLAIGVDAAGADSAFTRKKHAQVVADHLADGTSGDIFDDERTNRIFEVDTTVLLDATATYASVANAIRGVIQRSRPVDVFVFYFAGESISFHGQDGYADYFLKLSGTDSTLLSQTTGSITPRQLQMWLNVIPARNQLVILDAADGAAFLVNFTRLDSLQRASERRSLNTNLAAVAASYPNVLWGLDSASRATWALTPRLIEALGAGEFETVTAHRLLQDLHVRPTPFESTVLRYAEGNDFPLGINYDGDVGEEIKNRVLAQLYAATGDVPEQSFDRSRNDGFSVMVDSVGAEARIRLRIGPPSLATEVVVNGRRAVPDTSSLRQAEPGVFRVSLPLESLSDSLRVTAFGDSGTYARRNVAVSVGRDGLGGAASPTAGAQFARSGKDYALIFATNTYEQWPSLTNPLFDAKAIAMDLSLIYGFEVRLVENPTRRQIRDSLQAYAERGGPQDQLLVFLRVTVATTRSDSWTVT